MFLSSSIFNNPRKSILIVDDDEMIVELLSLAFENSGFKVFKAVSCTSFPMGVRSLPLNLYDTRVILSS